MTNGNHVAESSGKASDATARASESIKKESEKKGTEKKGAEASSKK